jgi:hypothetical protein
MALERRHWSRRRASGTVALGLVLALLLAGGVGVYRYLDSLNWWAPYVDYRALDTRARAALPPGATEGQVVAWLRAEDFPEDRIRLTRYRYSDGSLHAIQAWVPQRRGFWKYTTVTVRCDFAEGRDRVPDLPHGRLPAAT